MARYRSDNLFQIILELSKVRITIAVALTTVTGYILGRNGYDAGFVLPTLGIFFLACGSSVINHLQESRTDAIMARTSQRPLPAKKVTAGFAVVLALTEFMAGSAVLYLGAGMTVLLLGWFAMFWYNVVYSGLKRKTAHAVIPGSVIGSIPPLVGWVSAGGAIHDIQALMMALFFFVWQVPHFYLLAVKYGHEYEKAGLPSLTTSHSAARIKTIVFIWIILTALSATGFALSRPQGTLFSAVLILLISILLVYTFASLLKPSEEPFPSGKYFMKINYYVLAVIIVLVSDPLLQNVL
jgi:protoheme IX farnesyltransferase